MKNGLPIWTTEIRVNALESILAAGAGHKFVKIDDRTINSAEIQGIYTPAQYEEIANLKQGMWQCAEKKWHKRKEECECKKNAWQILNEKRKQREQDEANRPMTEEERARARAHMDKLGKELRSMGILKRVGAPTHTKEGLTEYERLTGQKYEAKNG